MCEYSLDKENFWYVRNITQQKPLSSIRQSNNVPKRNKSSSVDLGGSMYQDHVFVIWALIALRDDVESDVIQICFEYFKSIYDA